MISLRSFLILSINLLARCLEHHFRLFVFVLFVARARIVPRLHVNQFELFFVLLVDFQFLFPVTHQVEAEISHIDLLLGCFVLWYGIYQILQLHRDLLRIKIHHIDLIGVRNRGLFGILNHRVLNQWL